MLFDIKNKLNMSGAKLVAVSKTKPVEAIMAVYNQGQRMFGENKVQELLDKKDDLPSDIEWHLIGHLQSNKVKYIVDFVSMIHSVDSFKLLNKIQSEAENVNRIIPVLLQIRIASEETKFGFDFEDLMEGISKEPPAYSHVKICGVMGMATFTDDLNVVRQEFKKLHRYFIQLRQDFFSDDPDFKEISMGMSGDYHIALEEGATLVRIGSLIFGHRN